MKSVWLVSVALPGVLGIAGGPLASPLEVRPTTNGSAFVHFVGSVSSNSSSGTSSNSGAYGRSFVHTQDWSIEIGDGGGRHGLRGSARLERHAPAAERHRRPRAVYQHFNDDD